jgi:pectinesterase
VQAVIDAAPQESTATNRWVIFIRAGEYRELLYVQREKRFVLLVGEDPARTRHHLQSQRGDNRNGRPCDLPELRFLGWQDTLLLNRGRQYIERSLIAGHVDFVFGDDRLLRPVPAALVQIADAGRG